MVIGKVEMRTFDGSMIFIRVHKCYLLSLNLGDRHQRSVLNFTFRDSPKDFINVAYLLPPKDLIIVSSKFSTGDIGKKIYMRL